jgi:methionyl-tRNA formyltransferase
LTLAYLGTSDFAVDVLERLVAANRAPALVVTLPDRPKGRRRRPSPPPTAVAARERGIALHQTADVNSAETAAALREARASLGLVCAFGQIIREPLLSDLEMLNIHPSLLPRWRGAAPIERAIMAGDEVTGAVIASVTAGLDSGPIALVRELPIAPGEDYGSLAPRLATLGAELAVEALRLLDQGPLELHEQGEDGATYAEKIAPAERRLDLSRSAQELSRTVRALTPHIGAHLELNGGERLGVSRAEAVADGPAASGVAEDDGRLLVGCAEGALRIGRVKPAGGREMDAVDYLRGHALPELPG